MREIAFNLSVSGLQDLTKVDLGLAAIGKQMREVKKEIDLLNNGTEEQIAELTANGKSVESLTLNYSQLKDQQITLRAESRRLNIELRQQAKDFDRISQDIPDDSLIGLRRRYEQLRQEIDRLGKAGRESADGLDKIRQAADIKGQIDSIGESVGDFRSQVGSYSKAVQELIGFLSSAGGSGAGVSSIIDPLAGILGGIGGGGTGPIALIQEFVKIAGVGGTAVTAIAVGAVAAFDGLVKLTREYEKQFDLVNALTDLTGNDLFEATTRLNAITTTFGEDFTEVLRAGNSLSREFGITFSESLDLIEEGLLSNAQANNEYLDGLREYSVQAAAAGISAERFNQVLIDQTRLGIFSDKGIDSIKEATENIGRFEDRAVNGFNRLGLDAAQIGEDLASGFVSVQDVIGEVAEVISELPENSIVARRAIEDIFGTPGVDAGRNFIETLVDLGDEAVAVERKLTPYQERLRETLRVTKEAEIESATLAATFAGLGVNTENLGTQIQTLGTRLVNDVIGLSQSLSRIAQEEGLFSAISAAFDEDSVKVNEVLAKIREENNLALADVNEATAESAAKTRQAARDGLLSLQGLRAEQSKVIAEIDAARVAGEDYADLQTQLNDITKQITVATKAFNTDLKEVAETIEVVAQAGSIQQLTERVSELQEQIANATPNRAKELIDDLNEAELNLSDATRELEEFTRQVKEANISALPIEEQVELIKEGLEQRRQLELAALDESLKSEQEIALAKQQLNLRSDVATQEQDLRLLREGSSEYLKLLNEIQENKEEIEELDIKIVVSSTEEAVREYSLIQERLLNDTIDNEEELQARITQIRLDTDVALLEQRLALQTLNNIERLELERDLQQKLEEQRLNQARVDTDFDARNTDIDNDELNDINSLIPEFNAEDIEGSLQAIKDFEEQRTLIQLEAELERLQLRRELFEEQNEDTLGVLNDIAQKELEIDQLKNKALIDQQEKAQADRKKLQDQELKTTIDVYQAIGEAIGNTFIDIAKGGEDANEAVLKSVLSAVEKVINLYLAQILAQEIATKSFVGIASAAALTAIVKGAFAVARSAIAEEGAVLGEMFMNGGTTGGNRNLRNGSIFTGNRHASGGVKLTLFGASGKPSGFAEAEEGEAIIKRTSTQKWRGLLSAINEDTGGKKFSYDSEKWKKVLAAHNKYEFGDITGVGVAANGQIPTIVNPNDFTISARISPADMNALAMMVSQTQAAAVRAEVAKIGTEVALGIDDNNRLRERQLLAEQNSEI